MKRTLIAATLALSMIAMAPAAMAAGTVGASGQCYDDDGSGGDGHVGVSEDGSADTNGLTDVGADDPTPSVADGVLAAANDNGDPSSGDVCTEADDDHDDEDGTAGQDYIEVHAAGNQVCYNGSVQTDGSCATSQG